MKPKMMSAVLLVSLFSLALLFIPAILAPGGGAPFCPQAVSAQDNPCLAQEATLSVLQFQSTLADIQYNSRISTLESQLTAVSSNSVAVGNVVQASATAIGGLPFTETFDDNARGWDLKTSAHGAIRLSSGRLVISTDNGYSNAAQIPDFNLDEFYIEVDAMPLNYGGYVGFDVKQSDGTTYAIELGRPSILYGWSINELQVDSATNKWNQTFSSDYTPVDSNIFWNKGPAIKLGLEFSNGLLTLYVNDSQTESVSISGTVSAGLFINSEVYDPSSAAFDNLIVRQSK